MPDPIFNDGVAPTVLHHSLRSAAGFVFISGPDGVIERETLQCCHCQGHWVVEPGSGTRRGFCMKCNHVTCGKSECDLCVPAEKMIEAIEKRARIEANLSRLC